MEDDQNGRRPKWKMTKMEKDKIGRQQMEDKKITTTKGFSNTILNKIT